MKFQPHSQKLQIGVLLYKIDLFIKILDLSNKINSIACGFLEQNGEHLLPICRFFKQKQIMRMVHMHVYLRGRVFSPIGPHHRYSPGYESAFWTYYTCHTDINMLFNL